MELTAVATQNVATNQNVLFTETPVRGTSCILHREGSGNITLKGNTNQCRALYQVTFGANIAVPAGGTAGPVSVAIAIDGETLPSSQAIITPTAAGDFFNVFSMAYVAVPRGCCAAISVENTSTQEIVVANANIVVTRVA